MKKRQQLVEQYIPLANKLAFQKKRVLPAFIDIEDIKSAAYLGLVEAASKFDFDLGVSFSTFAYRRIFGAIHDHLRKDGFGKRGEYLTSHSLNDRQEDGSCMQDSMKAKEDNNRDEFLDLISVDLDNQAKEVIQYYFIDEYSMKEVGEKFGVSESRISQLIKSYKEKIRSNFDEDELYEQLAA